MPTYAQILICIRQVLFYIWLLWPHQTTMKCLCAPFVTNFEEAMHLFTCLWNTCMHQTNLVFWLIHSIQWNPSETSQNGSKQGISQMAIWAWWSIGSMIDSSNSERLRGFCDWRMDRQTDICDCRVAFATENVTLSHKFYSNFNQKFLIGIKVYTFFFCSVFVFWP